MQQKYREKPSKIEGTSVLVVWLIGISGAGKTTLGTRLQEYYQQKGTPNYLLDGDEARSIFDGDLGYSREDREANIKRIILAAYVLDRCDIVAIVCNISPFESLRSLARSKIVRYHEIYLRKDVSISKKDDIKGVYADNYGKTELIGVDIGFDEPLNPSLIIEVDRESVEDSYQKLISYIEGRMADGAKI